MPPDAVYPPVYPIRQDALALARLSVGLPGATRHDRARYALAASLREGPGWSPDSLTAIAMRAVAWGPVADLLGEQVGDLQALPPAEVAARVRRGVRAGASRDAAEGLAR